MKNKKQIIVKKRMRNKEKRIRWIKLEIKRGIKKHRCEEEEKIIIQDT